jgi:hypothetical protein
MYVRTFILFLSVHTKSTNTPTATIASAIWMPQRASLILVASKASCHRLPEHASIVGSILFESGQHFRRMCGPPSHRGEVCRI